MTILKNKATSIPYTQHSNINKTPFNHEHIQLILVERDRSLYSDIKHLFYFPGNNLEFCEKAGFDEIKE
jgi:hypothetical protein